MLLSYWFMIMILGIYSEYVHTRISFKLSADKGIMGLKVLLSLTFRQIN